MAFQVDERTRLLEEQLLAIPPVADEYRSLTLRLAAAAIRRQANQHGCREASTGVRCDHPDHPRDRFYAAAMLEALEVPRGLPLPTDEERRRYLSQEVPARRTDRPARPADRRWAYDNHWEN